MAGTTEQLIIRFRGICGHIDLPNGTNGGKRKRTVLVRHQNGNGRIEHHVPYVEFFKDDVDFDASSAGVLVEYSKRGVDGRFARVDLDEKGTEIRLEGPTSGYVEEELGYERDVPHMSEVVAKPQIAKGLLTKEAQDVDWSRVTAVVDLPKGRLCAGEPEALETRFDDVPNFRARRLARWTDLYTTFKPPLVLKLVTGGTTRTIKFKESLRMITIGNEPERLIYGILGASATNGNGHSGHNGQSPQPTGHYVLYYNLLDPAPSKQPLPRVAQIEGSGCPNNQYP